VKSQLLYLPYRFITTVLLGTMCVFGAGCGVEGETFEYVTIRGTVTCEGNPVQSGEVRFAPREKPINQPGSHLTGKPAYASIKSDGTYVLTTSTAGGVPQEGVVVGAHRISITPSSRPVTEVLMVDDADSVEAEELEEEAEEAGFDNPLLIPLPCAQVADLDVLVTATDSVINIEMSGGGKITKGTSE